MSIPPPSQIVAKMRLPPGSIARLPFTNVSPLTGLQRIDRVGAVDRVVGAVQVLESGDVQHHVGLGRAPLFEREPAHRRLPDVGRIGHQRVFERIHFRRQRSEPEIFMAMLESERVAQLVKHGEPCVVTRDRAAYRRAEPCVARACEVPG